VGAAEFSRGNGRWYRARGGSADAQGGNLTVRKDLHADNVATRMLAPRHTRRRDPVC